MSIEAQYILLYWVGINARSPLRRSYLIYPDKLLFTEYPITASTDIRPLFLNFWKYLNRGVSNKRKNLIIRYGNIIIMLKKLTVRNLQFQKFFTSITIRLKPELQHEMKNIYSVARKNTQINKVFTDYFWQLYRKSCSDQSI